MNRKELSMGRVYYLDDYRKLNKDVKERLERIQSSLARIEKLKEELIREVKEDGDKK